MKLFFTALVLLVSVSAALFAQTDRKTRLTLLKNTESEIIIRFDLASIDHRIVNTSFGEAAIISFADGTPLLEAGAPDLAKFTAAVQLPNTGNSEIEILDEEHLDLPGVMVAPSKGNLLRNVDPDTVPFSFGNVYQDDAFYPGRLASLKSPFIQRDLRGQAFWLFPLQYNPKSHLLRVYSSLTVRIKINLDKPGENELRLSGRSYSPAFESVHQKTFVNYNRRNVSDRSGAQEPERMLVITRDNLLPALQPLLDWKRQLGIYTTVKTVEEIGSNNIDALQAVVQQAYEEDEITYLLLVGNEDNLSTRILNGWSCDNCFGYTAGVDRLSDVLVGRLHAQSPEELAIMVARQLEYEKYPLADTLNNWCATGLALASAEGPGDDGQMDFEQGNEWKFNHLADGFESYFEFYDGDQGIASPTPGTPSADQPGDPQNTAIVDLMNTRGVGLFNYTGHGWAQGLASGNFSTPAAVDALRNVHRYPIVIAVACCVGDFTNTGGDCLGEAMQRASNPASGDIYGAVSGFYSSDFQSWNPPMEGQDGMNQYLLDADGTSLHPTIGAMAAFGNALMITAYNQDGEVMADFWNHFGEPACVPRTKLPQPLTASAPTELTSNAASLTVNCPIEGALAGLYWNGQTLAAARVENGVANLQFPPLANVGELILTVSQFNYIPYQTTIPVKSHKGPLVVQKAWLINDTAANNNGEADFGETISIDLSLENVGLEDAQNVSATLLNASPFVTLLKNKASFGQVEVGDSAAQADAFSLGIADPTPFGHKAELTLLIQYNDSFSLTVPISIPVRAPRLAAADFIIDDATGGNGNGRLESGETAVVSIQNYNTGDSDSEDAVGTLTASKPFVTVSHAQLLGPLQKNTAATAYFTVTVAQNAPDAAYVEFNYAVVAGNYTDTLPGKTTVVNAKIESFESQNFQSYDWELSGDKSWVITTNQPFSGDYCSRSGSITHGQKTKMTLDVLVSADGQISFARRVNSEENYDFLRFYIDNTEIAAWSGELSWQEFSFPVTAGQHEFSWVYEKDEFISEGFDRAWVDEILLPPFEIAVSAPTPNFNTQFFALPNPTSGWVEIWGMDMAKAPDQVVLRNLNGQVIQEYRYTGNASTSPWKQSMDMADLPAGLYFVQIKQQEKTAVVKVVKY